VLVFMQLGFRDSLYDSASSLPRKMQGDLFLMHKQTEALWRTVSFPRRELFRAFGHPAVTDIQPLYIGQRPWKNPETRAKRTLMLFGYDPEGAVFAIPEVTEHKDILKLQDKVMFDELSKPDFGPVKAFLAKGPLYTEVNDRGVEVIGTIKMGISFASDGNAITSSQNFMRIVPERNLDQIDLGIIRLSPGSDVKKVQHDLQALVNEDMTVFTYTELVDYEKHYWQERAPIGFIFGFGMVMGLVVGMVIVYQILFTDITNHLSEYATLKAMGYTNRYLNYVVLSAALILAVIGFVPGVFLSAGLYHLSESVTFIPMPLPFSKIMLVFSLILVMCVAAGLMAMGKLKSANPADMF